MNRIGLIVQPFDYIFYKQNIKRDLLYFDQLLIDVDVLKLYIDVPIFQADWAQRFSKKKIKLIEGYIATIMLELLDLISKNIITGYSSQGLKDEYPEIFNTHNEIVKNDFNFDLTGIHTQTYIQNFGKLTNAKMYGMPDLSSIYAYYATKLFNDVGFTTDDDYVIPLLSSGNSVFSNERDKKKDVLDIVLKKIPVPDSTVPIEQIIEIKSDSSLREKLSSLRSWMIDISNTNLTKQEMTEKFEYLYNEYKVCLDIHKAKTEMTNLRVVVLSTVEILENLLKFKWSSALKSLFEIFDNSLKFKELEFNAKGKEIAYIYELNQKLIT